LNVDRVQPQTILTSGFSREAVEFADGVTPRVILVDGKELAQLMIDHGVGVTVAREYRVKRLDLNDPDQPVLLAFCARARVAAGGTARVN